MKKKEDCRSKNINQKPKGLEKSSTLDAIGRFKNVKMTDINSECSRLDFFMRILGID